MNDVAPSGGSWVGRSVKRREDRRLLTGNAAAVIVRPHSVLQKRGTNRKV